MRLAFCYVDTCRTLSKLPDYEGNPDHDSALQDWIDRHMHGLHIDTHPGGRLYQMDDEQEGITRTVSTRGGVETLSAMEAAAVQEVRAELAKVGIEMNDYRNELRIDAVKCHQKHGQPSHPGKLCIDYQSDSKRLGRKDTPKDKRIYLCTFCPYESSVTVTKRANRGDYRR